MKPVDFLPLSEFPLDTYVFISDDKRKELFENIEEKYGFLTKAGKELNITSCDLYFWKLGFCNKKGKIIKRYIPLSILERICKSINEDVDNLQKYISELKTNSRSGIIKNPTLSLPIIPETFAILAHFLGDGYGGENGNSNYTNTSKEALYNFVDKLKKSFGDVEYSINLKHKKVIVSKIVPKILKKYFEIDDFRSSKFYITQRISDAPRGCLVELIKAFIIDEGRIGDSGIQIELVANPKFTKELQRICQEKLGYKTSSSRNCFIISCKSFPLLLKDMKNLVIPEKEEMLLKWFKRKSRSWYNKKKNDTKKEIVKLLLKTPMTTKDLSLNIGVKTESIRTQIKGYYLNEKYVSGLVDLDLVKPVNKGWRNANIFGIKDRNKAIEFIRCENG
jgi:hypothetical protein